MTASRQHGPLRRPALVPLRRFAGWPAAGLLSLALSGCFEPSASEQVAQAKARLDKGENAAAVILLKSALQQDAKAVEARFLLGRTLLQTDDAAAAEIELNKALAGGYAKEQVAPLLAEAQVKQGQYDKALSAYKDTQLAAPKQQGALKVALGNAYLGVQKFDLARASADEALKLDADSLPAVLLDAQLLSVDRQYDRAVQRLDQALARWPNASEAWELKAAVLQARGASQADVGAAFAEAVKHAPRSLTALSGLFSSQLGQGDTAAARKTVEALRKVAPKGGQALYAQAMLALSERDYKSASEFSQALLKLAPESSRALHLAGAVDYERGAFLRAEASLAKVVQAHPEARTVRLLLARTYVRLEEPAKALQTLQPLLSAANPGADVLTTAGQANLAQGKPAEAEKFFARAVAADPKDYRGRTALAVARLELGREEQGVEELVRIAAQDREPRADMELISVYLRRGDLARAQQAIDALDKKLPKGVEAPMLRAQLALARGDTAQARAALEAALQRRPSHLPAAQALAELDVKDKKPADGLARLEKLLKVDPGSAQARLAVIGLKRQMGMSREDERKAVEEAIKLHPNDALPRLALADFHLAGRDYKAALNAATDGAAQFPDDPRFYDLLGQAQQGAGDLNQAKQNFQKSASLQPRSPLPHMKLAGLYIAVKDAPSAIASLKRATAVRPEYVPAHAMLVGMLAGAGRFDEARAEVNEVRKLEPGSPQSWILEGNLLALQKNWNGAATAYAKALSLRPDGDVAVRLYSAYQGGGRARDAAKFESDWLAAHPHELKMQLFLGDNALARKDLDEAAQRYTDALKGAPDLPVLLNNLAWVYQLQGKPEAIDLAQRALKLSPNVPSFLDTLARAYAANKQADKAVATQTQLLALDPNEPEHRLHMAEYQIQAGNKDAAREQLKTLAAMGKKFPGQADVQRLLQSL